MPRKKTRNANGSHTIYYVENKKHWQGQICIGFKEDGKPNRKSVYGKTRKEVADKIKQIEYGIHTGTFTDKSEITIYHLAKQMIDESYNLNEIKDSTYLLSAPLDAERVGGDLQYASASGNGHAAQGLYAQADLVFTIDHQQAASDAQVNLQGSDEAEDHHRESDG